MLAARTLTSAEAAIGKGSQKAITCRSEPPSRLRRPDRPHRAPHASGAAVRRPRPRARAGPGPLARAAHVQPQPRPVGLHSGDATGDGEELTIQSTGIGGPSAAIVFEELIALGLERAVYVAEAAAITCRPRPRDRIECDLRGRRRPRPCRWRARGRRQGPAAAAAGPRPRRRRAGRRGRLKRPLPRGPAWQRWAAVWARSPSRCRPARWSRSARRGGRARRCASLEPSAQAMRWRRCAPRRQRMLSRASLDRRVRSWRAARAWRGVRAAARAAERAAKVKDLRLDRVQGAGVQRGAAVDPVLEKCLSVILDRPRGAERAERTRRVRRSIWAAEGRLRKSIFTSWSLRRPCREPRTRRVSAELTQGFSSRSCASLPSASSPRARDLVAQAVALLGSAVLDGRLAHLDEAYSDHCSSPAGEARGRFSMKAGDPLAGVRRSGEDAREGRPSRARVPASRSEPAAMALDLPRRRRVAPAWRALGPS